MAELTVLPIGKVGLDQAASGVAVDVAGDTVKAASGLLFQVINSDNSIRTITIAAPVASVICPPFGSLPLADIVHVLADGSVTPTEISFTIPLGYADANNNFFISYDTDTSTTIGVFSLA